APGPGAAGRGRFVAARADRVGPRGWSAGARADATAQADLGPADARRVVECRVSIFEFRIARLTTNHQQLTTLHAHPHYENDSLRRGPFSADVSRGAQVSADARAQLRGGP